MQRLLEEKKKLKTIELLKVTNGKITELLKDCIKDAMVTKNVAEYNRSKAFGVFMNMNRENDDALMRVCGIDVKIFAMNRNLVNIVKKNEEQIKAECNFDADTFASDLSLINVLEERKDIVVPLEVIKSIQNYRAKTQMNNYQLLSNFALLNHIKSHASELPEGFVEAAESYVTAVEEHGNALCAYENLIEEFETAKSRAESKCH